MAPATFNGSYVDLLEKGCCRVQSLSAKMQPPFRPFLAFVANSCSKRHNRSHTDHLKPDR